VPFLRLPRRLGEVCERRSPLLEHEDQGLMETTKLIQRVRKPRVGKLGRNPFTFGAGGGRLQPQAMDLLEPVFTFDYMMKAEYEFGAVPEGLNKIFQYAKAGNLGFSSVDVQTKDVKFKSFLDNDVKRTWKSCPVYIIGSKTDQTEIERRVMLIATDEDRCMADMWQKFKGKLHDGLYLTSEPMLDRYIKIDPSYDDPVIGWLELENGFFFTVDPSMAERFAALFGLMIEIKSAKDSEP
jgi:hypothetical protein